jgi:hypothetical protein
VQGYDSETTIVQGAGSAQKSGVRTDRFTRSQRVTRSMTSRADRGGMLSCIKSARPPSSIAASWTQQAMAPICQRKRSWLSTERAALAGGGHAANAVPDDPRVGINARDLAEILGDFAENAAKWALRAVRIAAGARATRSCFRSRSRAWWPGRCLWWRRACPFRYRDKHRKMLPSGGNRSHQTRLPAIRGDGATRVG